MSEIDYKAAHAEAVEMVQHLAAYRLAEDGDIWRCSDCGQLIEDGTKFCKRSDCALARFLAEHNQPDGCGEGEDAPVS